MEFIIWGVTPLGKYLVNKVMYSHKRFKPVAFVDNNPELWGTVAEGIDIISYQELLNRKNLQNIRILLAIKDARSIFQILGQMENTLVANIGIVNPRVMFSEVSIDLSESKEILWSVHEGKRYRIIPRIEVNLIDACNLKCKGCTHFSSIYEKSSVYPLTEYKRDLLQLRKVGGMLRLRLLGGEPFLLGNLDEYITIAREIFPEAGIEIVTNGLLIPEIDERLLLAIKTNHVSVTVTPYQPTLMKKEKIVECLEEHGIVWHFEGEEISEFFRSLTLQNTHNAEKSNKECLSAGCAFLRKGKLYKCPLDGLVNDFYHYYGLERRHESGMDIYQEPEVLYEKLIDYALKPVEMCRYCAEKPERIPWMVKADPILHDWLFKDGVEEGNT